MVDCKRELSTIVQPMLLDGMFGEEKENSLDFDVNNSENSINHKQDLTSAGIGHSFEAKKMSTTINIATTGNCSPINTSGKNCRHEILPSKSFQLSTTKARATNAANKLWPISLFSPSSASTATLSSPTLSSTSSLLNTCSSTPSLSSPVHFDISFISTLSTLLLSSLSSISYLPLLLLLSLSCIFKFQSIWLLKIHNIFHAKQKYNKNTTGHFDRINKNESTSIGSTIIAAIILGLCMKPGYFVSGK